MFFIDSAGFRPRSFPAATAKLYAQNQRVLIDFLHENAEKHAISINFARVRFNPELKFSKIDRFVPLRGRPKRRKPGTGSNCKAIRSCPKLSGPVERGSHHPP
jgi:hypothetical protein